MGLFRKKKLMRISFGVPYFDLADGRFTEFTVPVSVRGIIAFRVKNHKQFHRQYSKDYKGYESFQKEVRQALIHYVKSCLAEITAQGVPVMHIESKIGEICEIVKLNIKEKIKKEFNLIVSSVDITAIELDKTSKEYEDLKAVTVDATTAIIQAETNAKLKDIYDRQRLRVENMESALLLKRKKEYSKIKNKWLLPFFVAVGIGVSAIAVLIFILI